MDRVLSVRSILFGVDEGKLFSVGSSTASDEVDLNCPNCYRLKNLEWGRDTDGQSYEDVGVCIWFGFSGRL